MHQYARHVRAVGTLVAYQPRLPHCGIDAHYFIHCGPAARAWQGLAAIAPLDAGHDIGAPGTRVFLHNADRATLFREWRPLLVPTLRERLHRRLTCRLVAVRHAKLRLASSVACAVSHIRAMSAQENQPTGEYRAERWKPIVPGSVPSAVGRHSPGVQNRRLVVLLDAAVAGAALVMRALGPPLVPAQPLELQPLHVPAVRAWHEIPLLVRGLVFPLDARDPVDGRRRVTSWG